MGSYCYFFFNDTATTEIYTLSLHDALPISRVVRRADVDEHRQRHPRHAGAGGPRARRRVPRERARDRKSTRLNSSHANISYAVFCLKKTIILLISVCVMTSFTASPALSPWI